MIAPPAGQRHRAGTTFVVQFRAVRLRPILHMDTQGALGMVETRGFIGSVAYGYIVERQAALVVLFDLALDAREPL